MLHKLTDVDSGNVRGWVLGDAARGSRPCSGPKNLKGAGQASPPQNSATAREVRLLITFILVEPVLGAGEVLRPIVEVEIPTPRLYVGGLPIRVRRVPGEVSIALPRAPIL